MSFISKIQKNRLKQNLEIKKANEVEEAILASDYPAISPKLFFQSKQSPRGEERKTDKNNLPYNLGNAGQSISETSLFSLSNDNDSSRTISFSLTRNISTTQINPSLNTMNKSGTLSTLTNNEDHYSQSQSQLQINTHPHTSSTPFTYSPHSLTQTHEQQPHLQLPRHHHQLHTQQVLQSQQPQNALQYKNTNIPTNSSTHAPQMHLSSPTLSSPSPVSNNKKDKLHTNLNINQNKRGWK